MGRGKDDRRPITQLNPVKHSQFKKFRKNAEFNHMKRSNRPNSSSNSRCNAKAHTDDDAACINGSIDVLQLLITSYAHDVLNLVTCATTSISILRRKLNDVEQQRLDLIASANNRIKQITEQLLSAVNGKKNRLGYTFCIVETCRKVVKGIKTLLDCNIEIIEDYKIASAHVVGLQELFESVVINLISNAKDAIKERGQQGRITISLNKDFKEGEKPKAALVIRDNGCGIPPENLHKIFRDRYSTKEEERHLGMGLKIVKSAIDKMNGRIIVRSQPGETVFKIVLPCLSVKCIGEETVEGFCESRGSTNKTKGLGGVKILIVEDEEMVRLATKNLLESEGAKVIDTEDSEGAIDVVKNERDLDVILLDANLKHDNGLRAYHMIRDLNQDIPVIFCSAIGNEIRKHLTRFRSGVDFLAKPYEPLDLIEKIQKLTDKERGTMA